MGATLECCRENIYVSRHSDAAIDGELLGSSDFSCRPDFPAHHPRVGYFRVSLSSSAASLFARLRRRFQVSVELAPQFMKWSQIIRRSWSPMSRLKEVIQQLSTMPHSVVSGYVDPDDLLARGSRASMQGVARRSGEGKGEHDRHLDED